MKKIILLVLICIPYFAHAALPDRSNAKHNGLNIQELFDKLDIQFKKSTI